MKNLLLGLLAAAAMVSPAAAQYPVQIVCDSQFTDTPLKPLRFYEAGAATVTALSRNNGVINTNIAGDTARLMIGTNAAPAQGFIIATNTAVTVGTGAFTIPVDASHTSTQGVFWYTIQFFDAGAGTPYFQGTGTCAIIDTTAATGTGVTLQNPLDWTPYVYSSTADEGPVRPDGVTITNTANADGSITLHASASGLGAVETNDAAYLAALTNGAGAGALEVAVTGRVFTVSISGRVDEANIDLAMATDTETAAAATAATNYTDQATNALRVYVDAATNDLDAEIEAALLEATTAATNYTDQATNALRVYVDAATNALGLSAGDGLAEAGSLYNGTLVLSHADTSETVSGGGSGGSVMQAVELDGYGHLTGMTLVDLDDRYPQAEAMTNYVDAATNALRVYVDAATNKAVLVDGTRAMEANLDMGDTNDLVNVKAVEFSVPAYIGQGSADCAIDTGAAALRAALGFYLYPPGNPYEASPVWVTKQAPTLYLYEADGAYYIDATIMDDPSIDADFIGGATPVGSFSSLGVDGVNGTGTVTVSIWAGAAELEAMDARRARLALTNVTVEAVTNGALAAWPNLDTDSTDDATGAELTAATNTTLAAAKAYHDANDATNDAIATAAAVTNAALLAWPNLDTDSTDDGGGGNPIDARPATNTVELATNTVTEVKSLTFATPDFEVTANTNATWGGAPIFQEPEGLYKVPGGNPLDGTNAWATLSGNLKFMQFDSGWWMSDEWHTNSGWGNLLSGPGGATPAGTYDGVLCDCQAGTEVYVAAWTNGAQTLAASLLYKVSSDAIATAAAVTNAALLAWPNLDTDSTDDATGAELTAATNTTLAAAKAYHDANDATNDAIATAAAVTNAALLAWPNLDTDSTDDLTAETDPVLAARVYPNLRLDLGGAWGDFEVKASTNNFTNLVYYYVSSAANTSNVTGDPVHTTADDTNAWSYFTDDYRDGARGVMQHLLSPTHTSIVGQFVSTNSECEVVSFWPSRVCDYPAARWMSATNSKLVWAYVRFDGVSYEYNATATKQHWVLIPNASISWQAARTAP